MQVRVFSQFYNKVTLLQKERLEILRIPRTKMKSLLINVRYVAEGLLTREPVKFISRKNIQVYVIFMQCIFIHIFALQDFFYLFRTRFLGQSGEIAIEMRRAISCQIIPTCNILYLLTILKITEAVPNEDFIKTFNANEKHKEKKINQKKTEKYGEVESESSTGEFESDRENVTIEADREINDNGRCDPSGSK